MIEVSNTARKTSGQPETVAGAYLKTIGPEDVAIAAAVLSAVVLLLLMRGHR
jgi:hypothetical protein